MSEKRQLSDFWQDLKGHSFAGATAVAISSTESILGVKFPEILKQLLLVRDGGVPRYQLYHVTQPYKEALPDWLDHELVVVEFSSLDDLRTQPYSDPPEDVVAIAFSESTAIQICLDFRKCDHDDEPEIVCFGSTYGDGVYPVAPSLRQFVENLECAEANDCYAIRGYGLGEAWAIMNECLELKNNAPIDFPATHSPSLQHGFSIYSGTHGHWKRATMDSAAYFQLGPNIDRFKQIRFPVYPVDTAVLRADLDPLLRDEFSKLTHGHSIDAAPLHLVDWKKRSPREGP